MTVQTEAALKSPRLDLPLVKGVQMEGFAGGGGTSLEGNSLRCGLHSTNSDELPIMAADLVGS